jgi:hypothetical protein
MLTSSSAMTDPKRCETFRAAREDGIRLGVVSGVGVAVVSAITFSHQEFR